MIPDTQIHGDVPTNHIVAAGRWIREHCKPKDRIIIIGDWWDFPSLSSYDEPGSIGWEDKDLDADFEAGNQAMYKFFKAIGKKASGFQFDFIEGNHEHRLTRAASSADARRFGSKVFSKSRLNLERCKFHPFLRIIEREGISYSHYFSDPNGHSDRPIGGTIQNRLRKLMGSFVMGHQQEHRFDQLMTVKGKFIHGLVSGKFYQHDEGYRGPQKNKEWSGINVLNDVRNGEYDIMPLSQRYLLKEYT
jgi:hypothetical protein